MQSFWDKKCDAIRKHLEAHLGYFMGTLCELGRKPFLGNLMRT